MKFLLNEVFDYPGHYATLTSGENATPDIVDAILGDAERARNLRSRDQHYSALSPLTLTCPAP